MTTKQHGGRRDPPGGRPRLTGTGRTIAKTITLTPDDLDYLLSIDPNLSQAVRELIRQSRRA